MRRSALALRPTFAGLARAAAGRPPSPGLRDGLARIGREGERAMFAATCGVNTHRGAIWALGLLVAAAAIGGRGRTAARSARHGRRHRPHEPDAVSHRPTTATAAPRCMRYGVGGARGQAAAGFPHVLTWRSGARCGARARRAGDLRPPRRTARGHGRARRHLPAASRRSEALAIARNGAQRRSCRRRQCHADGRRRLAIGSTGALLARNASPGGSADLLAAALFLDRLDPARRAWSSAWEI